MPNRSLLNQLGQIRGTTNFDDLNAYSAVAEQAGSYYSTGSGSGTLAVVSGSATVTDTSNVFQLDEQNNFIIIDDGAASGVYQITTVSSSSATVFPTPTASDATASYRRHYYKNLEDDLNYLRTMLNLVIGETNWYDEPTTDLKSMATHSGNTDAHHIQNTDIALGSGAVAYDHGTSTSGQIVNVCYGTGSAPTANTTTIGSLFIKYTE